MSVTTFLYHIVLRTRFSTQSLVQEHERDVYACLFNICKEQKCIVHRIGGMPDHIHLLLYIPPTIAVSSFIRILKSNSSRWIVDSKLFPTFLGWGKEYAAFTYAFSQRDTVINYIKNQKEHHRVKTFKEELRDILHEYNEDDKLEYLFRD